MSLALDAWDVYEQQPPYRPQFVAVRRQGRKSGLKNAGHRGAGSLAELRAQIDPTGFTCQPLPGQVWRGGARLIETWVRLRET